MSQQTINIARDFSKYPAGRFLSDGPYPGALCRDKLLIPALRANDTVTVELDGTLGYGSSFLEEAFGGMVRERGFTTEELERKLRLITSDSSLSDEIWQYVKEARTV